MAGHQVFTSRLKGRPLLARPRALAEAGRHDRLLSSAMMSKITVAAAIEVISAWS